ncbi:helix-turn-helix transcriptional regulator [Lactobacillus sp. ESL0700]|uniref:response regulator transcription factor n=1 Tax=Lactobacillus sp. ESL0700 TaxID=2983216 RepID=UPI0023F76B46|nr:helix-turn-helix transcriptional regulator [Lactobacillus sp. ESL0700]WEV50386.1 helix-turn-helix transcriptional regulator [Lactobacillus sp. ESL0700]
MGEINLQEIFIYIYNIAFIILYLWVINVASYAYKITNNNLFYYVELLFVILIIDSTFAFSFDLLKATNSGLNIFDRAYYLARVLFFLIAGDLYVKLVAKMLSQKTKPIFYLPIISVVILDIIHVIYFYNDNQTVVWQRSIQDAGIFVLCIFYYFYARKRQKQTKNDFLYNKVVFITALFMALSCIEGIVYFALYHLSSIAVQRLLSYMKVIGLSEDLFSVILSLLIIWFARQEEDIANKNQLEILLQHKMNQYQAMIHEKEVASEDSQVVGFCEYYKMTKRESEILRLVLKGKKNQEIADELFISVGTVKSHIYSIFKKLEVDRRSQLMHVFMEYKEEK